MALGPLMLGLAGPTLSTEEKDILRHPQVGGVILFTRNYQTPEQLAALTTAIRALRQPPLLLAVDHEGGRVQRFREHFATLPAARRLGDSYDRDRRRGCQLAQTSGWLMAAELRAVGVDFSFAPVLDVDRGLNTVIGDRAFHHDPAAVTALACAYVDGMHQAGMAAVGKHFPGHGGVAADSHHALPVDGRTLAVLAGADITPFARLIAHGVEGMMPAHVLYPAVDAQPAGFSARWLQTVLRQQLGFQGAIFSDDLDMAGAAAVGTPAERAQAALAAGCDMVLACNDRQAALAILDALPAGHPAQRCQRLVRLYGRGHSDWTLLRANPAWRQALAWLADDGDAAPP